MTARICNTGDAEMILSVAGQTGLGGWNVEGWYKVMPGKCFSRRSSWEYQFSFALRYRDANGTMGPGNFEVQDRAMRLWKPGSPDAEGLRKR